MEADMKDYSTSARTRRQDRRLQELVHDPYKSKRKLPEPTICPVCFAVYHEGRWVWRERPSQAHQEICPACDRTRDQYPAGQVTVEGPFSKEHRGEILNLAWNLEQKAKAEHPLDRILAIEEQEDTLVIKTTDIHLPRAVGEALHRAYQGELEYHYNEEEYYLGVSWKR
jgi:hypothetical protein